jgi:hypothetical protein
MAIKERQQKPLTRNLLRQSAEMYWSRRLHNLACAAIAIVLGLASRRYGEYLPSFIAEFAGDTLWALMVFIGIGFVIPDSPLWRRVGIALSFAFAVEVSQLYTAPWIEAIRQTTLGGLVLGFGFLWTDLVCYAVGVFAGALLDYLVFGNGRKDG